MKKIIFGLLILLFAGQEFFAQQQWERTQGPVGTMVNSIKEHAGRIYAGTSMGVFYSLDEGMTWQPDVDGIYGGKSISDLSSNGETLVAATSDGIYYKTGNGAWILSEMINSISKVISNGEIFLAKRYGDFKVFRSTDGIHWEYTGYSTGAMGTNGNTLLLDTIIGAVDYIARSDDGMNWENIDVSSLPGYGFSAIQGDGTVAMFSRFEGGVFRSTDNGATFTQVEIPTGVNDLYNAYNFTFDGTNVYTSINGQKQEIFYSADYGVTWQKRNPDLNPTVFGWGGIIVKDNYQIVASAQGIHRSTDGGITWAFDANNGMSNSKIRGFLVNQDKVHALLGSDTMGNSYGLYTSDNLGQSWHVQNKSNFGNSGNLHFGTVVNGVMLVENGFTLSRSTDNGLTWNPILTAPGERTSLYTWGNRVLMSTQTGKIFYSDDMGLTWTQASSTNIIANSFTSKAGILFAGTAGGVERSTDNGDTWASLPPIIPGPYDVIKVASNDEYIFAVVHSGGAYTQLYRSDDNGQTWENIQGILPVGYWPEILVNGNVLLVGTDPMGYTPNGYLYKSTDNGNSWASFKDGIYVDGDISGLGYFGGKYWASVEGSGLWSISEEALGLSDLKMTNTIRVFPNPVTDVVSLSLSETSSLDNITLFDMNGRIVKLWEKNHLQFTNNTLNLDMQEIMRGLYVIAISSKDNTQTFKICKQ